MEKWYFPVAKFSLKNLDKRGLGLIERKTQSFCPNPKIVPFSKLITVGLAEKSRAFFIFFVRSF